MNKTMIISIISTVVLIGCMFTQHQKLYPFSTNEVTVEGDTIYCTGKPFAKIWSINGNFYREERLFSSQVVTPKGSLYTTKKVSGLGLAIFYYDNDKMVWIHPEKGLSVYQDGKEYTKIEDMQRVWSMMRQGMFPQNKLPSIHSGGRRMEKEDLIRSVVYNVWISDDGKYIYYDSQGVLWNSSHKYLVEYGISK